MTPQATLPGLQYAARAHAYAYECTHSKLGTAGPPTLIVNCAGINGGMVAGDDGTVVAIRGQIVKAKPRVPSHSR